MVDGTLTDMFLEEVFHFIGRKDKPFNVDDLTEFFLTTWEEEVEEFKDNLIIFSNSTANSRTPFSSVISSMLCCLKVSLTIIRVWKMMRSKGVL